MIKIFINVFFDDMLKFNMFENFMLISVMDGGGNGLEWLDCEVCEGVCCVLDFGGDFYGIICSKVEWFYKL